MDSKVYWEDELIPAPSELGRFAVGGRFVTLDGLRTLSSRWGIGLRFQAGDGQHSVTAADVEHFTKSELQQMLYQMYRSGNMSPYRTQSGRLFTLDKLQRYLEELGSKKSYHFTRDDPPCTLYALYSDEEEAVSDVASTGSKSIELAYLEEKEEPVIDELEGDELLKKIVDNLQTKTMAVKRYKKVGREVVQLRKLLDEKEEDLKECERVILLESGQV